MNIYEFSTYMTNFVVKCQFFCTKRQNQCSEKICFKSHFGHWFYLFHVEHKKCYFKMKFIKYVDYLYMFITKFLQNILKCFNIYFEFFFSRCMWAWVQVNFCLLLSYCIWFGERRKPSLIFRSNIQIYHTSVAYPNYVWMHQKTRRD